MVHHKVIMKMENIFTPKGAITKLTSNLKQVSQRSYNEITRLLHHRIGMGFRNILDVKKRKKEKKKKKKEKYFLCMYIYNRTQRKRIISSNSKKSNEYSCSYQKLMLQT